MKEEKEGLERGEGREGNREGGRARVGESEREKGRGERWREG